jgi:ABC-type Fe3+ transport system substrate-binding protein
MHGRLLAKILAGIVIVGVAAVGCAPAASTPEASAPASVAPPPSGEASQPADPNAVLTREQIIAALKAEGQVVTLESWGFGGLDKEQFPQRFREYTQQEYGVPLELVWDSAGHRGFSQAEQAGLLLGEFVDVLDREEDSIPKTRQLGWDEKINLPQYASVLTNWDGVEDGYIVEDGLGVIYQGFEWLGIAARKDKVDVAGIRDWTDLADPKYKGTIVTYPLVENRGQFIFVGVLNSLIKQGIVQGDLWSEEAWLEGLKWWKQNIEPNVLKYGGTDEMATMLQSGEAGIVLTWGSYVRELQASEWNLRDDVVVPVYPASGMAADRETIRVMKGTKKPVSARVLVNWMLSSDFLMAGWYKDPTTGEEKNRWDITKAQFLTAYAGGINADQRKLVPDWSKPFYPDDPGALIVPVDFPFFAKHIEWAWEQYQQLP